MPNVKALKETAVIILACGADVGGWTAENPKQLVPIDGEPLLARTIRHLNGLGYENILVATHKEAIKKMGVNWFTPEPRRWVVETFLSTRPKWGSNRTIVMAGDTAFSDAAMHTITTDWSPIGVHGNHDEIFAVTFLSDQHNEVAAALEKAIEDAARGGLGYFWQFYRALFGSPLRSHRFEEIYFREISFTKDSTTDFDTPGRYKRWLKKTGHRA